MRGGGEATVWVLRLGGMSSMRVGDWSRWRMVVVGGSDEGEGDEDEVPAGLGPRRLASLGPAQPTRL